ETGQIDVLKVQAAHDCGRAINPLSAEGQIDGSVIGGIGQGLFEDLMRKDGIVLDPSFIDYKLPTALETPIVKAMLVEPGEPAGPFGAKGFGEGTMLPTAPAIANALVDALGIRLKDLPLTPEKVLQAMDERTGRKSH
ncbi:MAG: molybdopterin-dependent oxidoreductase, partial [Dehalococcoidia bacterium]|nr:molybdopterin-dependent oxidoreductase [Dehalococcoidia bacterium]